MGALSFLGIGVQAPTITWGVLVSQGKDYLGTSVFARSPSGTGGQVNLFGVLGLVAGIEEGLELNVLGLTFGVDPNDVALELPLVGTLGFGAPVTASMLY